jgi:Zn-dependent M28 family amino/carboxypeptidase
MTMRLTRSVAAGGVAVMAAAWAWAQPGVTYLPALTREEEVARFREHVVTLANPFFEGRGTGSRGNDLAAEYVAFWFRQIGLEAPFDSVTTTPDGVEVVTGPRSYLQPFQAGQETVAREAVLEFTTTGAGRGEGARPVALVRGKDFEVFGISGSDEAEGEAVFCGYAIERGPEPEYAGYSSFKEGDDLRGKVAIVLRFEPMTETGESRWAVGAWSAASSLQQKIAAVAERGAAAVLVVNPPGVKDPRGGALPTTSQTARGLGRAQEVPVAGVTTARADQIVRAGDARGRSLEDLRRLADEGGGVVPLPGVRVRVGAEVERVPRMTANVGGLLRGRGELAEQYVVIGAHFDHVGDGSQGGSVKNEVGRTHPGADDNASGTAGLLVMAERLSRMYGERPAGESGGAGARSILFLAFSGEEIGLLGSRHFVHSGVVSASSIYAMLNMDMIGRLREGLFELHGTGTAEGFEDLLGPAIEAWGMKVKRLPGGRGPSDHASFYAGSIPVLFFFTGFHPEYHTPGDVSRLVDAEGGVKVLDLVTAAATLLSQRTEPLVFRSTDKPKSDEGPRLPADHVAQALPAAEPGQRVGGVVGTRVRFGIAPGDYSESETGVLVGDVYPGTSAAEADIRPGDRLMKWNGATIDSVEVWMGQMARHKPGDVVEVTIVRKGEEIVKKVTLRARDDTAK